METLSFFGRFVLKVIVFSFSASFDQKSTQQSDGSCNVTIDSHLLYKISEICLLISANTYEKHIVIKKNCIALHDDKMCFLPTCRYLIILIGDSKELPQKMDAFRFNYQHVDCLYTVFKCRFSGKTVVKNGQTFDIVERAVDFNHRPPKQRSGQNSQHREKDTLEEKVQKQLLSSFQKTKSSQTSELVFAHRIKQVKKIKLELELIKFLDCFVDGHENYISNWVSFKLKLL